MKESTPHTSTGEILSKASILVALPQLQDTFFAKSVILLIEHNSSGAFGFVINRPTDVALKELIYLDEKINLSENARVWFGGPVSTNSGIILEYRPDLLSMDALPFNITTKKESLLKMVTKQDADSELKSCAGNLDHEDSLESGSPISEASHDTPDRGRDKRDKKEVLKKTANPPLIASKLSATDSDQVLNYMQNEPHSEIERIITHSQSPKAFDTINPTEPSGPSTKKRSEAKAKSPPRRVLFPYRFIMGYSGWNQDQLEEELILGNWIQLPFDEDLVFNTPVDHLWEQCFTNLGTSPEAIAPTIQPYLN